MAMKLALVLLVCALVTAAPVAESAISCGTLTSNLTPCLAYLIGSGSAVPKGCCAAVKALNNAAKTTPDRRTACKCIKSAASSMHRLNLVRAGILPSKCGVRIPYKISPSTNCNTVR